MIKPQDCFFVYTNSDCFLNNLVEVYYDGVKQTITDVADVDGTVLANGGAFVKTVDLYVTISGSPNKVCVKVPVNDQVAVCAGLK